MIVYKLENIKHLDTQKITEVDLEKISFFIRDKKKEALMDEWTQKLKEKAEIWRNK